MRKKIKIILLVALISIMSFINVNAVDVQSIKDTDLLSGDNGWEQVVDSGFGSKNNTIVWSMREYQGYLYVGTRTDVKKCQIYRSQTGDKGTWEQVIKDGFDENYPSDGVRNMVVYKDLLWAVTDSWDYGSQIFVTNGEDNNSDDILKWKKANRNGFGEGNKIQSSRSLIVYKDKLYVGARSDEGPHVYRYDGPIDFEQIQPENWSIINQDMLENKDHNPLLVLPGMMMNFTASDGKEYLYLGIYEEPVPILEEFFQTHKLIYFLRFLSYPLWKCEIWRYNGSAWEKAAEDGFGHINVASISAQVLNNTLYFGTSNTRGIEIWKTVDGKNWTQIVKRGLGRPFTRWCWRMHTFENRLIFGTYNVMRGCQIWASTNDNPQTNKDFIQINIDRMGNKDDPFLVKQDGVRAFETFKGHLYAGTASFMDFIIKQLNGSGCEVWRLEHLPSKV